MEASLAKHIPHATWAPKMYSIEDFVPQLQQVNILDPISLTFELWPIYKQAFPNESFDQFYAWGQMIVADFNEVDLHLIDGGKIFQNLAELKRIDVTIDGWLNEDGKLSTHQHEYMRFWELLGVFYQSLQAKLSIQGMASPGQALRSLVTKVKASKPMLPWKRVIFAGFNALAPAEENLILALIQWDLADCYWDLDAWYTENEEQEAGKFFRELRRRWEAAMPQMKGNWNWIGKHLETQTKEMVLTAVPKRVGQAKAAGLLLEEMAQGIAPESLALVLPDENLLFPVLHSLPESLRDVNVTMGYPLRNTPLYGLIDSVLTLHENAARLRPGGVGQPVYYFRDIISILRHPYIHQLATEEGRETMRIITQENMIYLAPTYFMRYEADHILRFLFEPWTDLGSAIRYLLDLFLKLKTAFEARQKTENPLPTVESEILFQFFSLTQKLQTKLDKYLDENDLGTFRRIYREVIVGASLPFAGEPLKGIQVMGMLETRVLDFDRLILLSVNEGILPPKQQQNSLIPYGIRKAFLMPTHEDRDAVYAYHFYRLMQRARHVQLIYDTQADSQGGGEKSRFIAQIEAELLQRNPGITVRHETFTFPALPEEIQPIIIQKDADVLKKLIEKGSDKGFSPSALNTYLSCSLQFYFQNLLKLKEKDVPEETMEDNTFGMVVHGALELLYKPLVGQTLQAKDIAPLLDKVDDAVEKVFTIKTHSDNFKTGRNRLLLGVIRDLVRQMLELDMAAAPIELMALEQEMEAFIPTQRHPEGLKLRGYVDRVDRAGGRIRIIDYKTGQVTGLKVKNFLDLKEDKPQKEVFQLGSYAYLYHRNHNPDRAVYPGIFGMRNLPAGFLTLEYGPQKIGEFDLLSLAEFEGLLVNIFDDLLDPDLPFTQTADEKRCIFCAFKTICNRH
ncbi:MAG: PD-(D/E)XK nuclease family protein [Bacteroidetes bacterium]|nr:PD-(D/E)XK nuclease family protein [Bacteroidota bacterium]